MLARFPETEAFIPGRIFKSRANQLAVEPESAVKMHLSGRRGDNSQKTRWGLSGVASFMARASSTFHHFKISFSIFSRHERSVFLFSSGSSARNVSALS